MKRFILNLLGWPWREPWAFELGDDVRQIRLFDVGGLAMKHRVIWRNRHLGYHLYGVADARTGEERGYPGCELRRYKPVHGAIGETVL